MKSKEQILGVLKEFRKELHRIYGDRLADFILFGSYARGEQTEESDLDALVLLNDFDSRKRWDEYDSISGLIQDFFEKTGIFFSIKINGVKNFKSSTNIFLNNVLEEGISV